MPSAKIVGGLVAGFLSAVLAARSLKSQVAAAMLAGLAPVTVAQLLRAVGAGLRDGELVAVEGVAHAERPLTSIDGSLAVLARTVAHRLFTTVFDTRTRHANLLGVSVRCADWSVIDATPPDAIGSRDWGVGAAPPAANTVSLASAADVAVAAVPVRGAAEAISVSADFLSSGGRQHSASNNSWVRKGLQALATWGRVDQGTRFTDSILPQGAPVTVVGSVKLDAGTNAVSLVPHSTVGMAVLSGMRSSPSDKVPGLKKLVAAFRASSEYRLVWSVVLGCLSLYLLRSGIRRRAVGADDEARRQWRERYRQRHGRDRERRGRNTRVMFGAFGARMRVQHPDAVVAARLGLQLDRERAGVDADGDDAGDRDGGGSALDVTPAMAAADVDVAPGQDDDACVVCYERRRCCVFLECGHMACCATCALVLTRGHGQLHGQRKCPVCRKYIRRAVKVFGV